MIETRSGSNEATKGGWSDSFVSALEDSGRSDRQAPAFRQPRGSPVPEVIGWEVK
ncbi:unnamed protein product, partial [marine sediment metagenome]